MISPRHMLFVIATFGLIAVLVFLYYKTQAVNLSERNDVIASLHDLQEIESRWDNDMSSMRLEMEPGQIGPPNRAAAAQNALRTLSRAMHNVNSAALSEGLGKITRDINEKANLIEQFKAENGRSKDALHSIQSTTEDMGMPQAKPLIKTRKASSSQKEFTQALNRLSAAALGYYWTKQGTQRRVLETESAHMLALSPSLDALAHEEAGSLYEATQTLLKSISVEQELSSRIALLNSGTRLRSMSISFNQELEATLAEKEQFRVYMIAYAAALLIGVGYLGIRTVAANEMLEFRVAARTRELSEALRHLKESEAQLIQSEKMSSLGQMVAGVAHEINTPLAYVSNSLSAVNERLPDIANAIDSSEMLLGLLNDPNVNPEDLNRQFAQTAAQLDHIKQHGMLAELTGLVKDGIYGSGQVAEIVSNLRDFSRLDRSKVSSFNLNDGLSSTLGLARHLLKSIKVTRNFGEIPSITCAPSQVNQVFLNLITNAAQALPAQNGEITLTSRSENNGVAVEVADNGSGIPPDVMPKIFDPFFTTKEIGKGTGLGLSISYQIVKDHGGRIDVESKVGVGTKFTVWLPVKPPAEDKISA